MPLEPALGAPKAAALERALELYQELQVAEDVDPGVLARNLQRAGMEEMKAGSGLRVQACGSDFRVSGLELRL